MGIEVVKLDSLTITVLREDEHLLIRRHAEHRGEFIGILELYFRRRLERRGPLP